MKKAWKREHELFKNSQPVVLSDDEQNWDFAGEVEKMEDIFLGMKWFSNVPGSGAPERVILGAIQAVENLGFDTRDAEKLIDEGLKAHEVGDFIALNKITARIWKILNEAPKNNQSDYWQHPIYDAFETIERDAIFPRAIPVDTRADVFRTQTYLAWQAQIVGGAFGTALEGYTSDNLKKAFGDVRDYVRKPNTYNDDITYEIAFLDAFVESGYHVESHEIAEAWVARVPFGWSAEEWALKNIKMGIYPPRSGIENNPYREWIGAQMRGAICGMVAPGNPMLAAKLAFIDGRVSHYNNGILGEVFNAVLLSLAYVETDVRTILKKAIDCIPSDAQYRAVLDWAIKQCETHDTWQEAWAAADTRFERYNWIHSYPNAAAEVLALWYGKGDFDETLHIVGMAGYDVDCNAAQIMPVIAIINQSIPSRWTEPFGDRLDTYVRGMKQTTISALTERTINAIHRAQNKPNSH